MFCARGRDAREQGSTCRPIRLRVARADMRDNLFLHVGARLRSERAGKSGKWGGSRGRAGRRRRGGEVRGGQSGAGTSGVGSENVGLHTLYCSRTNSCNDQLQGELQELMSSDVNTLHTLSHSATIGHCERMLDLLWPIAFTLSQHLASNPNIQPLQLELNLRLLQPELLLSSLDTSLASPIFFSTRETIKLEFTS